MREALKKAIEVLKNSQDYKMGRASTVEAVADIERALAQPETPYEVGRRIAKTGGGMSHLWSAVSHDGELAEAERGFKDAQLKEPEQEPVAAIERAGVLDVRFTDIERALKLPDGTKLYTTPPQRTWVGLTRAERFEIEKAMSKYYDYQHQCKTVCLPEFAAAIEAKLRSKNHD